MPALSEPINVTLTRRPTNPRDPFETFLAVRDHYGHVGSFLLESLAGPVADRERAVVGFAPLLTITIRGGKVSLSGCAALVENTTIRLIDSGVVVESTDGLELTGGQAFWDLQRQLRDAFLVPDTRDGSYSFGVFAVYGYDAVHQIEDLPYEIEPTDVFPELTLVVPQACVSYDLHHGSAEIIVANSDVWPSLNADEINTMISASHSPQDTPSLTVPHPLSIEDSTTYEAFEQGVQTALGHVVAGDIYQMQLGHELTVTTDADPLVVYQRLRQRNPSPYMCFIDLGVATLISASPELFLRISGDAMIMRPLAGTAPRSGDATIDAARVARLVADEKERAEHIMLVDLCRNDLGRVARIGSVTVDELIMVEDFSHVFHLVSTVTAAKENTYDAYDAIRATFPAGTMTGAPKIRAMEIIEHLETARRGGYAGAFGLLDVGGFVNTGLTIRSMFVTGKTFRLRASAGIVADSVPATEWRETLAKLSATYWAVTNSELLDDIAVTPASALESATTPPANDMTGTGVQA
ncbi:MAG: anthranilate synthase component I family protein [Actinomycetota bacterium]